MRRDRFRKDEWLCGWKLWLEIVLVQLHASVHHRSNTDPFMHAMTVNTQ